MKKRIALIKEEWRRVKSSQGFHNAIVFLLFVVVAAIFWFILAMNDSVTDTVDVELRLVNVPDSVTFITEPPNDIHVTLRDKGTTILRTSVLNHPVMYINFRDFTNGSSFRYTKSDLDAGLKAIFGSQAQIGSVSIDSLSLRYTTGKGVRVPVVVKAEVTASAGNVISGLPESLVRVVRAYSAVNPDLDTISHVFTNPIIKRNLSETTEIEVPLQSMPGVRFIPSKVIVRIPVEPLVKKEALVTVRAEGVPANLELLLFPAMVPVSYYVPMSRFGDEDIPVEVTVHFSEIDETPVSRLPLSIHTTENYAVSPQLTVKDVEYTIVSN